MDLQNSFSHLNSNTSVTYKAISNTATLGTDFSPVSGTISLSDIQTVNGFRSFSFGTLELYESQPIKSFLEFFFEAIILYVVQAAHHYFQR